MNKPENILRCPLIKLTGDFEIYQDVLSRLYEQKDKKVKRRYLLLGVSIASAGYSLLFTIYAYMNGLDFLGTLNLYVLCLSALAILIISSVIREGKK